MKTYFKSLIGVVALVAAIPMSILADDFDIMRENLRREIFVGPLDYDPADPAIQTYLNTLYSDATKYHNALEKNPTTYLWSDYNHLVNSDDASTHVRYSLTRLHTMALAWVYPGTKLYHDSTLLYDIKHSLDFMYDYCLNENTPAQGDWWSWRIGSPGQYAAIVSILYDQLSATQIDHYYKAFTNHVRYFAISGNLTYANQADICRNLIYMGVLANNASDIVSALDKVKRAFVDETTLAQRKKAQGLFEKMIIEQGDYHKYNGILKKEGLYEDGTFIQHCALPYIGTYGTSMVNFTAEMYQMFEGTQNYGIPAYFYTAMPTWIEKAYIPAIYKCEIMRMFMGRQTTGNSNPLDRGRTLCLNIFSSTPLLKDTTLRQRVVNVCYSWYTDNTYYSSLDDGIDPIIQRQHVQRLLAAAKADAPADEFNIVLAAGDRVIHETAKYRLGIAMSSNRIGKYEGYSNNNVNGWYTGDGMVFLYTPNNRSHWIKYMDKCNAYRLPGITVDKITRSTSETSNMSLFDNPVNAQSWVGGISLQGRYGAAGMSHVGARSDLVAKKSWFMFTDEIVCLGAGISMSENRDVETIVEQRAINNGWYIDGVAGTTKKCWDEQYTNPKYAYINEVGGYYFPEPCTLTTYIESNKYYSLFFNHGKAPVNQKYAYVMLPQMPMDQVAAYAQQPAVRVLHNSDTLQAVYHDSLDIVGINYWQAGKTASVASDGEASLMLRHRNDTLFFAVSDPTWKRTQQVFVLDGVYTLLSATPSDQVTISNTSSQTTITINCTDRMGMGHQLVLHTQQRMPKPGDEPLALTDTRYKSSAPCKQLIDGQLVIRTAQSAYSVLGQSITIP